MTEIEETPSIAVARRAIELIELNELVLRTMMIMDVDEKVIKLIESVLTANVSFIRLTAEHHLRIRDGLEDIIKKHSPKE